MSWGPLRLHPQGLSCMNTRHGPQGLPSSACRKVTVFVGHLDRVSVTRAVDTPKSFMPVTEWGAWESPVDGHRRSILTDSA